MVQSDMCRAARLLAAAGLLATACRPSGPGAATAPPTIDTATPAAEQPAPAPPPTAKPAPASPAPSPAPSAPLVVASITGLTKTLHPYPDAASYTSSWIDLATLIWGGGAGDPAGGGGLVEFDWGALEYRPAIARQMPTLSEDARTYTFTLRDDVTWSDGSSVTADDFAFAWENARKQENDFVGLDQLEEIASYRAPDRTTIEVTLKRPKPRDVALATVNQITPVPRKVWQGKPWNDPVGNPEILNPSVVLGPYKVQEFKAAEHAALAALDSYYVGRPRIPRIEFAPGQPAGSGRAQWMPIISSSQYQEARGNPDLTAYEWVPANASYRVVEFNLARRFLSDKRVREALSRALSRDAILDLAEQGLAVPQYTFIPPTNTRWVNDQVERYDFDLDRAKQLLQEAGFQPDQEGRLVGQDGEPVKLQLLWPTSSAPREKMAAYMQRQYGGLGMEVESRGLDFGAYTDQVSTQKDFDISLGTYGGGSLDPELGPKPQLVTGGQQNVTGYSNPEVDELFRLAGGELDESRRRLLYQRAQQLVDDDLPAFYISALKSFSLASRSVQGIRPRKGDRLDYNDAILSWSVDQ